MTQVYTPKEQEFLTACKENNPEQVKNLLTTIKNPNICDEEGNAAFFMVTTGSCIHAFVDAGVDVRMKDKNGLTMLHHLGMTYRTNPARYLITHGATVNEPNQNGVTPLHLAALSGQIEMIELFAQSGGNFLVKDKDGKTPLDYAKHKQECFPFFNRYPVSNEVVQLVSKYTIQQLTNRKQQPKNNPFMRALMDKMHIGQLQAAA